MIIATKTELTELYKKIFEKLEYFEFDILDAVITLDEIFPKVSMKDTYDGSEEDIFIVHAKE